MFKKYGLKMNLDKTEVMWVGKQREELSIRLEGKANNFVYLGGHIYENSSAAKGGNPKISDIVFLSLDYSSLGCI